MMLLALLATLYAQEALGTYYLETFSAETRGELTELLTVAEAAGWSARVVRRYEFGEGWVYALVVEGFDEPEPAREAAAALAEAGGKGVAVYRREGRSGVLIEADWPAPDTSPDAPLPEADEVLLRASRALGGRDGGIDRVVTAEALHFRFQRDLRTDEGRVVARHDLLVSGPQLRLSVEILEGAGKPSLTVVHEAGAWVEVDGQRTERDKGRASEVAEGFSPAQILSYPLHFADLVYEDPTHDALTTVQRRGGGEGPCLLLEDGEGLSLCVSEQDWVPVEVSFMGEAGLIRFTFEDWREVDNGLVVPFTTRMEREGQTIEVVKVEALELISKPDPSLFE